MDTVLIIDDDRDMRLALSGFLSENGFDPLEARDGMSALKIVRRVRPDMILLDPRRRGER
jgi:two-component system nitrogen regulation response regulator NtrX